MKYCTYILLLILTSCNNRQQKISSTETWFSSPSSSSANKETQTNNETCWIGTLGGKTPVFFHYGLDSNLIIGEITYLDTKDKLPITLLGTIEKDGSYRLLEFEKSGNITGIITGIPNKNIFYGSWFSPSTRKEYNLSLVKKDTVINFSSVDTKLQDIFGHYHYQYSEAGYQGDFEITELPNSKANFGITSVTGEPARNVAQVNNDTISLATPRFIYNLPDAKDCEFEVKFYKGFAFVQYTKKMCDGQFGFNSTIAGIFIKTD
jgi:hypothetical protein